MMATTSKAFSSLRRRLEAADAEKERVIRLQGWRQEMLGYYWIWARMCNDVRFTACSVDEAVHQEKMIQSVGENI